MSGRPHDWSPLRGSDPVPGDPDEVERIGKRYADTARTLHEQAARLRALAHDRGWHSEAADEWRHQARDVAEDLAKVESRYDKAGGALRTYSGVLRQAQTQADAALELARDGEHRARAADRATEEAHRRHASAPPETPAPDTSQLEEQSRRAGADIATAQARVRAAEAARDAGAAAAERAIEMITGSDGLDDGRWAGARKWFGDKVELIDRNLKELTELAGHIAAGAGLLALAVSFIPIVGQVLAAVLTAVALIAGLVALIGSVILLAQGRGGWGDIAINVVGLLTFGTGRAALAGARAANRGARAAAQSGLVDEAVRGLAAARGGLASLGGKTVRRLTIEARQVVKPTMPGGGLTRDQVLQGLAHPPRSFPRVGDVLQGMRPGPVRREARASLPELGPALRDSGERLVLGRAPGAYGQTLLSVTADAERALARQLDDVARSMPNVEAYLSAGKVQLNLGRAMDGGGAVLEVADELKAFDEFKRRTTGQPLL